MFKPTPQKRVLFPRALTPVMAGGFLACLVLFGIVLNIFGGGQAQAATDSTLNFQARLETASGAIVPDGYYNVQFKLYNVSSAGSSLWSETYYDSNGATAGNDNRVQVKNGYLSVSLGSQTAFPNTINWDQDLWVTMNIGGTTQTATPTWDGEMNPRLHLTAVPYAFKAAQLAQYNSANSFTSTLQLLQPTGGNQVFQIPDQGAAGTYSICVQESASGCTPAAGSNNYIQNQNVSPQSGSNYWISGIGRADTALQAPILDTATADALNIGGTNATAINLGRSSGTTNIKSTVNGQLLVQNNSDAPYELAVEDSGGRVMLGVNSDSNTVQIGPAESTSAPGLLWFGSYTSNANGNVSIAGNWDSPNNWGIGSNSNSSSDSTLRFGTTTVNGGRDWNTNQNLNALFAGTVTVQPTVGNDSSAVFQIQNSSGTNFFTADSTLQAVTTQDLNIGSLATSTASRLFTDGFESNDSSLWDQGYSITGSSMASIDKTIARSGKYSALFTNTTSGHAYITTMFKGEVSVTVRAYVYVSNQTTVGAASLLALAKAGGTPLRLVRDQATGYLGFYNGVAGTTTLSSTVLPTGSWHELELSVTVGSTTSNGTATIRLDGTDIQNLTGINTGTTNLTFTSIGNAIDNQAITFNVDDVAVDTARPGTVSSNLNVADSLHVSGTSTFGSGVVIQSASSKAFRVQDGNGNDVLSVNSSDNSVKVGGSSYTYTPGYMYLSDASLNSGGNAQITGAWQSSNNWGIGSNSSGSDSALRIGITAGGGSNSWSTSQNVNLVVAGTEKIQPTTGNDSTTAFQVQNASGLSALTVDTTNSGVTINRGNLTLSGMANVSAPTIALNTTGGTLPNATTFRYRVAAYSPGGRSAAINSSPASLTTNNATSAITVTWSAVTGATGYDVYRSTDGGTTYYRIDAGNVTTITDNGSTYTWSGTNYANDASTNGTANINLVQGGSLFLGNNTYLYQNVTDGGTYFGDYNGGAGQGMNMYYDYYALFDNLGYHRNLLITNTGATTFQNRTDTANAFQVQNAGGTALFNVNTQNTTVNVGLSSTTGTQTVNVGNNATAGSTTTVTVGSQVGSSTTNVQGGTGGINLKANTTGTSAAIAHVMQGGAGDAAIELNSGTISKSMYLGVDTSTGGNFAINSSASVTATGYAQIAWVQSESWGDSASSTTRVATFDKSVTAGNLIVASVAWNTSATTTFSCSDSLGDTYTTITTQLDTTNGYASAVCYAFAKSSGTDAVTATFGAASTNTSVVISEYSGVASTSPVDVYTSSVGSATTATDNITSGSMTTTANDDLIYGATFSGANDVNAGTGFAHRWTSYGSGYPLHAEDRLLAVPGSIAVTHTGTSSGPYTAIAVAFKPAAITGSTDLFSTPIFSMTQTGEALFKNSTNSTTAFQIQDTAGTAYFSVDTLTGTVTLGGAKGGLQITPDGTHKFYGNSEMWDQAALSPEYPNSVLDAASDSACASANNGTMTSGFTTAGMANYYNWTSTSSTYQCYDVVARVPIPAAISDWSGDPLQVYAETDNTSNSQVAIQVLKEDGTVDSHYNYTSVTPGTSWGDAAQGDLDYNYSGDAYIIVKIRMSARNGANVKVGGLFLRYYRNQ